MSLTLLTESSSHPSSGEDRPSSPVAPRGAAATRTGRGAPSPVALLSLATALPPYALPQAAVAAAMLARFPEAFARSRALAGVFDGAGIASRRAARPLAWYLEPHDWSDRTAAYLDAAEALFLDAAGRALAGAGCTAADIDTVVTISSTGIATPSLEARVHGRMGFRADVERVPVFGVGCAGGVTGLALAAKLARARPGATVLVVAVELCTLAFRLDRPGKVDIVSAALFGDGAAAAVLRAGDGGLARITATGEHLWPDSLDVMGWSVDPVGFGVILHRDVPSFTAGRLGAAVDGILARNGLGRETIDRFVCHPGGARVVTAIEHALALGDGALDHERAVLRDHGNMSAPTVLFILARVIAGGLPGRVALLAMGPGFTASLAVLERTR